jgi:transposase
LARPIKTMELGCGERDELEKILVHSRTTKRLQKRIRLVLSRADGLSQEDTAKKVGISRVQVSCWEQRFRARGVSGLSDAPGRGRKPWLDRAVQRKILAAKRRRCRSARAVAGEMKVATKTVIKLWSRYDRAKLLIFREAFSRRKISHYSSGPRRLYWVRTLLALAISSCARQSGSFWETAVLLRIKTIASNWSTICAFSIRPALLRHQCSLMILQNSLGCRQPMSTIGGGASGGPC